MCCPHAGSRSTSTPTASCLMRRTSWPCRWALQGQMGTPRGHHCRGVWAVWSPHPHLGTDGDTPWPPLQRDLGTMVTPFPSWGQMGTPRGHQCRGVWAACPPHPHLGTAGDTPWPLLWGALDSVVPSSPPWGHPMATPPGVSGHHGPLILTLGTAGDTPQPLLWGTLATVTTPSSPWGHPMATPPGVSGHRGPPIPILGTPHSHCSRKPWTPWSPPSPPWGHIGATPRPPLQGYLGTMVPLSPP